MRSRTFMMYKFVSTKSFSGASAALMLSLLIGGLAPGWLSSAAAASTAVFIPQQSASKQMAVLAPAAYEDAQAAYRSAIALDPNDTMAHRRLAAFYESQSAWEDAAAVYQASADIEPGNAWMSMQSGHMYMQAGDYAQAEAAYRQAIAIDRQDHLLGFLANTVFHQGRLGEAERLYREAIAIAIAPSPQALLPAYPHSQRPSGSSGGRRRPLTGGTRTTSTARHPYFASFYVGLGEVLSAREDYQAAIEAYRQAIDAYQQSAIAITPGYGMTPSMTVRLYSGLGIVYQKQGMFDRAADAYRRVLAVTPHDVEIQRRLAIVDHVMDPSI